LHPEIGSIVEMVQLWTGSEYVNLDEILWKGVFVDLISPCYTFDLSKDKRFKYVPVNTSSRPGIEFFIAENNVWPNASLMLHTRVDLPDAKQLNGFLPLPFSKQIKKAHKVEIRKKIIKRESTRKAPCVIYEPKTCQSIEDNKLILERFHCSIPFLNSGQHLNDLIPKETPDCGYQVTLEALDFIAKKESNCAISRTCENTRFTSNYKVVETWFEDKNMIYVTFENPEVENHQSYISYDFISLVGEIGGILGITLGASVLTLFESVFMRFHYY
jgi:hypothetical protein